MVIIKELPNSNENIASPPPLCKIQFVHHYEDGRVNNALRSIERDMSEGTVIKIGRYVDKKDEKRYPEDPDEDSDNNNVWFSSKVVSRHHAEVWIKNGQIYIKDIGSSSGTFLNHLRLSPLGKESRPYTLKDGDRLQFGVDYKGKTEDVYKSVILKVFINWKDVEAVKKRKASPKKFNNALKSLVNAMNPYTSKGNESGPEATQPSDCPICLCAIAPFQALFLSPCSHVYHYKCVSVLLSQSVMFQCPMCRQVNNLTASVSREDLFDEVSDDDEKPEESKPPTDGNRKMDNASVEQKGKQPLNLTNPGDLKSSDLSLNCSQLGSLSLDDLVPTEDKNGLDSFLTVGRPGAAGGRNTVTPLKIDSLQPPRFDGRQPPHMDPQWNAREEQHSGYSSMDTTAHSNAESSLASPNSNKHSSNNSIATAANGPSNPLSSSPGASSGMGRLSNLLRLRRASEEPPSTGNNNAQQEGRKRSHTVGSAVSSLFSRSFAKSSGNDVPRQIGEERRASGLDVEAIEERPGENEFGSRGEVHLY